MTDTPTQTMKDVSHTPPTGDSVTNVWHRGLAGTWSPVDDTPPASD